jgi:hypothetical protein
MITFLDHAQGTAEWLSARYGRFTASEFGMFVMRRDAKAKTAFENNIMTKLGEFIDQDDCAPSYEDYNMKRGTRLEPYALAAYAAHTSNEVEKVGLAIHTELPLGFSADAMVNQRAFGLELKAPTAKIQLLRIREKVVPSDYMCQIHGSMFLAGSPHWDFFSWHPKLPAFYIRVHRDTFTEELGQGLLTFGRELKARKEEIEAMMAD